MNKLLYLCDWLPPDFGAVGQYSLHFARERARAGEEVVLVGLSSVKHSIEQESVGDGRLTVIRLQASKYDLSRFVRRMFWTLRTDLRLLWGSRRYLRSVDEILFTGSPPFMLHFLAPLNLLLGKKLVYRITDFHPECLMASMNRVPFGIRLLYRLTVAWRKTVSEFEILGEDQRRRLQEIGIPSDRIRLKRCISPVQMGPDTFPLDRPRELDGFVVLLYSGNFGVAHDYETFLEAYRLHHREGSGRVALWLNATGAKADLLEHEVRRDGLPIHRSYPVPLEHLGRLLITPDAHLITLRDPFVGFVLPSKVYGCIESGRSVMYVGSAESDIHLLCKEACELDDYFHADVGDATAVVNALEALADRVDASLVHDEQTQSVSP